MRYFKLIETLCSPSSFPLSCEALGTGGVGLLLTVQVSWCTEQVRPGVA